MNIILSIILSLIQVVLLSGAFWAYLQFRSTKYRKLDVAQTIIIVGTALAITIYTRYILPP